MLNVLVDYRVHDFETNRLLSLCGTLTKLSAVHQKLVAEIIILRLFDLFENLVSSVSAKLACGARYVDGTRPTLLVNRARSLQGAKTLFQTHGRQRPRSQLKWSIASDIRRNIVHVIDPQDNVVTVVDRSNSFIDELRRVRNRIAHNNAQSRKQYREIVRGHYGAYLNNVTPGVLLLSSRTQPLLIEQYIRQQRIIGRGVVKA